MKKMILGLMMVLSTLAAHAQFEAGKMFVGASVSELGASYSKQQKFKFDLMATAGCFVANDMLVLANVGYNHLEDFDDFEVGLGGRFYIEQNGLYLGLNGAYAHGDHYGDKTDNFFISPELGYAFFVNHYLTIEPAVYYNMSFNDFSDSSKVGLRIGFGLYF